MIRKIVIIIRNIESISPESRYYELLIVKSIMKAPHIFGVGGREGSASPL